MIKYPLKSTGKSLKGLEILLFSIGLDIDLNQYRIVVPLFGAAYAAPNKGTTIEGVSATRCFSPFLEILEIGTW